jgi:UDP-glucose 4-epimerase
MEINHHASINLASQASAMGVRRFVYLSSVKAAGERSFDRPLREDDPPLPEDFYGISKLAAEKGLLDLSMKRGMDVVVIRPPLVYGPGVRGNFLRLMDIVSKGVPLPLAAIRNKRSMVSVFNLVDFIASALKHEKAKGEVFFVSDNQDISTPELIRYLSKSQGKPARLFPVPLTILKKMAWLLGRSSEIERLTGSLQVSINKAIHLLGWRPPMSLDEGLKKTVSWYLSQSDI